MAKSNKKIVKDFYSSDFFNDASVMKKYVHPEMELFWNAKTGYSYLNYSQVKELLAESSKSFDATRTTITHLISKGNTVTIRFTLSVSTIERPEKMDPMAHFMTIWELKDGKLYKGYKMSQPVEEDQDAMRSWKKKK